MTEAIKSGDKLIWARGLKWRPWVVVDLSYVTCASVGDSMMPGIMLLETGGIWPVAFFDHISTSEANQEEVIQALSPCPCCGSDNIIPPDAGWPDGCVYCRSCGLRGNSPSAWNRRLHTPETAGERDDLIFVPGIWRCAKCKFTLVQSNLNAADGSVTARDKPGDKCPNDGSPLWRVSYRDWALENEKAWEELLNRKDAAIAVLSTRPPEVEALVEAVERFICDYDDDDRADAGCGALMELHIRALRLALSRIKETGNG